MNKTRFDPVTPEGAVQKHPATVRIEDVISYRMQRLVSIGERSGNHWSERLFDLSLNEWRLLALVVSRAPVRAGDLADLMMMDKSQTSRVIKAIEGKGLIRQGKDAQDGRAVALRPTAKGATLHHKIMQEVLASNERVLAPLSVEEVMQLDDMLRRLSDHAVDLLEQRLGKPVTR